jgi:hypothetical protein
MTSAPLATESADPELSRPRMFGGRLEPLMLPWAWATAQLTTARSYWIGTTRAGGRPHARPVWGVWLDGTFYFSTGSLAAGNLARSPEITVHLESGSSVVILEGVVEPVSDPILAARIVDANNLKYRWDLDAANLPGGFYAVRPRVAFGWVADPSGLDHGSAFHGTATRWGFADGSARVPAGR